MLKNTNKAISTPIAIVIIVVCAIVVFGGAFAYKYWWQTEGETETLEVEMPETKTPETEPVGDGESPEDETAGWQTYRNKEWGFEMEIPSEFVTTSIKKRFLSKGQFVVGFAKGEHNYFSISITQRPFEDYKAVDNAGGFVFNFDIEKEEWVHQNKETSEFVPKKVNSHLDAYVYKTGDIMCAYELIIVPHPSYNFVMELEETVCAIPNKDDYIPSSLNLIPETLLSTFKFID